MKTKLVYKVFEGEGNFIDLNLLENITHEQRELVSEMMVSGHFADGINIPKFLREDLSINLEKLELATTLSVVMLEANSELDVTLKLRNLDEYYNLRGIKGNESKEREERTFLLGFISSIAGQASVNDTLAVKYVA